METLVIKENRGKIKGIFLQYYPYLSCLFPYCNTLGIIFKQHYPGFDSVPYFEV